MARAFVLLVSDDDFTAGYVTTTLLERDFQIVRRSAADMTAMVASDASEPLDAAIIVPRHLGQATEHSAAWLRRQRIPYLLLLQPAAARRRDKPEDVPLLVEPFAAYQVADWVEQVIGGSDVPDQSLIEAAMQVAT